MNTTMTQSRNASVGWLAGWAVASGIGFVLGTAGTLMLLWSVTDNFTLGLGERLEAILFGAVFGLGVGLILGIAQWIVLRFRGESNVRWLGATVLGGILGGIVTLLFSNAFNEGGENVLLQGLAFAMLGVIVGTFQFALARSITKNTFWIAASAVAFGIAGFVALQFSEIWWGMTMGGALYGIVTAVALWQLHKE